MKIRLGVEGRFHGTVEIDVPYEDVLKRGGVIPYVERDKEEWAAKLLEQAPIIETEIEDVQQLNPETDRWDDVYAD
jgi:hypothetical protein